MPFLTSPLLAQHCARPSSIAADRPGNLFGPGIVPAGLVQLETGASAARAAGTSLTTVGATLLRVGVNCRTELRGAIGGWIHQLGGGTGTRGLGDGWLGAKVRLHDEGAGWPQLAVLTGAVVPSNSAYSQRHLEPEANLAAAWSLPHGQSVLAFAGVAQRHTTHAVMQDVIGASWSVPMGPVGSFLEYSQYHYTGSLSRNLASGLTLTPHGALQLDASLVVPFGPGSTGATLGVGLSRRW